MMLLYRKRFPLNILLSFILLVALGARQQLGGQQDREISLIWFAQAHSAYQKGDYGSALEFNNTSLEFDGGNSDSHFLAALLYQQPPMNIRKAIASTRKALELNSWNHFTPSAGNYLLGGLYYRVKEYSLALNHLRKVQAEKEKSDYFLLLSRVYLFLGERAEALATVRRGGKLFPHDLRFDTLLLQLDTGYFNEITAQYNHGDGFRDLPQELIIAVLPFITDQDTKEKLLDRFKKTSSDNPFIYVEELRLFLESDRGASLTGTVPDLGTGMTAVPSPAPAPVLTREGGESRLLQLTGSFIKQEGYRDYSALLEYDKLLKTVDQEHILTEKLKGLSATIHRDTNGDGFTEESYLWKAGELLSMDLDPDQDGINEITVRFSRQHPENLDLRAAGQEYQVHYTNYPLVTEVSHMERGRKRVYEIAPGSFRFPVVALPEKITVVQLPEVSADPVSSLSAARLREKAYKINEFGQSDNRLLRETVKLDQGYAKELDFPSMDNPITYLKIYRAGRLEETEWDVNGDNRYEIVERYALGKLEQIDYDEDQNGIPEYRLQFGSGKGVQSIQYWDFNGDGIFDCKELLYTNEEKTIEFSTKWDGDFDLKLFVKQNRLESVVKSGKTLPVVASKQAGVYWIGKVLADFTLISKKDTGLRVYKEHTLFVFKALGNTYLEVID